jgi:hypothetical protein
MAPILVCSLILVYEHITVGSPHGFYDDYPVYDDDYFDQPAEEDEVSNNSSSKKEYKIQSNTTKGESQRGYKQVNNL